MWLECGAIWSISSLPLINKHKPSADCLMRVKRKQTASMCITKLHNCTKSHEITLDRNAELSLQYCVLRVSQLGIGIVPIEFVRHLTQFSSDEESSTKTPSLQQSCPFVANFVLIQSAISHNYRARRAIAWFLIALHLYRFRYGYWSSWGGTVCYLKRCLVGLRSE